MKQYIKPCNCKTCKDFLLQEAERARGEERELIRKQLIKSIAEEMPEMDSSMRNNLNDLIKFISGD